MKRAVHALLAAACVFCPRARADEGNYRPYLIGARAGGMGGAFTALSDDPSGTYYNPAGIANVTRSQLSLSGSLFGVLAGGIKDALGDGQDFSFSDLQTFPIQTSAIYKIGDSPQALALSIFVPDSFDRDDRDDLGNPQFSFFSSDKSDTVWGGLSYARRFDRVSVGASVFSLFGTAVSALDLSATDTSDPQRFATITARVDELQVGLVGSLGVRWDVSDEIKLGLSVFSPEIGLYSRRSLYVRVANGVLPEQPPGNLVRRAEDLHASPSLPGRIQAGVAWTNGDVTLSADVIVLLPLEVTDDTERALEGLDRWVKRNGVVNGAAGVEVMLTPTLPFRAGAWTDFSASPATSADGPENSDHIDRVGGSLSLGLRGEHTESSINFNLAYAWGQTLIPDNFDFSKLKATDIHIVGAYLIFASSFQF